MSGPQRVVPLPTPERVARLVRSEGGVFYWRPRTREMLPSLCSFRSWEAHYSGKPMAIKRMRNGYDAVRVDKALIPIHRLVWVLHHGEWPKNELDHIDGDKGNNALSNLRDVTKSENMRNQFVRRDSSSGFPGVHFCKDKGRRPWAARVGINGKWKQLGYFATKDEAIDCRWREQLRYGFTERHGSAPSSTEQAAA